MVVNLGVNLLHFEVYRAFMQAARVSGDKGSFQATAILPVGETMLDLETLDTQHWRATMASSERIFLVAVATSILLVAVATGIGTVMLVKMDVPQSTSPVGPS